LVSPTGSAAEALPVSKVAGVTSDTTNVMPATMRELGRLPIFKGCIWVTCACHVLNSFLLDQVKQVEQIKELLVLAKGIVTSITIIIRYIEIIGVILIHKYVSLS
jgi:hypothetical protein